MPDTCPEFGDFTCPDKVKSFTNWINTNFEENEIRLTNCRSSIHIWNSSEMLTDMKNVYDAAYVIYFFNTPYKLLVNDL